MHYIVAVACLAECGHFDFFQQAGILPTKVRRFHGMYGEDDAIAIHFRKRQSARLPLNIHGRSGRSFFLLDVRHPLPLQINSSGRCSQNGGDHGEQPC